MQTTQNWKDTLSQGNSVNIRMPNDTLAPGITRGDTATVAPCQFNDLKQNEIVLCVVKGKVGLRRITQTRQMYGVRSIMVVEDTTVHHIQDGSVWGKVKYIRRQDGRLEGTGLKPSFGTFLRGLKRVIFPGT